VVATGIMPAVPFHQLAHVKRCDVIASFQACIRDLRDLSQLAPQLTPSTQYAARQNSRKSLNPGAPSRGAIRRPPLRPHLCHLGTIGRSGSNEPYPGRPTVSGWAPMLRLPLTVAPPKANHIRRPAVARIVGDPLAKGVDRQSADAGQVAL